MSIVNTDVYYLYQSLITVLNDLIIFIVSVVKKDAVGTTNSLHKILPKISTQDFRPI